MACQLHVIVKQPADPLSIEPAIELLDRLESLWSRFLPDSDITRINDGAGTTVEVAPETVTLVQTMKAAWDLTQGRYDPTILPILVANGYGTSRVDPALSTVLPPGTNGTGAVDQILVDPIRSTVAIPQGVALDAGGIGKGLAADMAVAVLLQLGAVGALVSIGGDLAFAGTAPEPEGWRIHIEHADPTGTPLCRTMVDVGGVATSSTRSRRWNHDGRPRHHAIDPATGSQSDTDLAAVTVFSTTGWGAEAFATGALLSGSASVIAYLDSHALSGLAITDTGDVLCTEDLAGLELATAGVS
jgi:thiamine biosynthesis lipoprotein